jgi:aspartate aminotransferase
MSPLAVESRLGLAARIGRISVSSTMKVAAEADRLRREGADVVDFSVGEPDFPTPANIKQAAIDAIHNNFTRYTPAPGIVDLRAAICERHRADYGTDYSLNECVVTVGGKHGIFNVTQAVLEEGDEAIVPIPYWVTFKDVVNYAGAKCIFAETDEQEGYVLTAAYLERFITPKTKLLIVNSPNNPSGAVISREEFEKIYHLSRKHGFYLMTDECYCRFLYDDAPYSIASMPGAKDNVIVAGSLSKTYAMTGWRIGFTLTTGALATAMTKLASHSTSNPTSIAQKAALEAVSGSQDSIPLMLAAFRERRDYVVARLNQIPGVRCAMPKGAFYAYPNISYVLRGRTSLQFAEELLAAERVATVPGEAFGTPANIRISYATSMEQIIKGMDRIERFIHQ